MVCYLESDGIQLLNGLQRNRTKRSGFEEKMRTQVEVEYQHNMIVMRQN